MCFLLNNIFHENSYFKNAVNIERLYNRYSSKKITFFTIQ